MKLPVVTKGFSTLHRLNRPILLNRNLEHYAAFTKRDFKLKFATLKGVPKGLFTKVKGYTFHSILVKRIRVLWGKH